MKRQKAHLRGIKTNFQSLSGVALIQVQVSQIYLTFGRIWMKSKLGLTPLLMTKTNATSNNDVAKKTIAAWVAPISIPITTGFFPEGEFS